MALSTTTPAGIWRRPWAREVGIALLFVLLSLLMTWPLVAHLGDAVLGPPGDNLEYVWKMWWVKHSLVDLGVSPFYNPDIFYPFGYPLALSETTLAHTLLGLPLTMLWGETVAYNVVALSTFAVSGYGLYRLLRALGASAMAGIVGGAAFAFCPYRMAHLGAGHLPLLGTGWIPFLFLSLERLIRQPTWRHGVPVGVFYALTALSSWYYALMVGLFAALFTLARTRPWRVQWRNRVLWQGVASAAIVASALVAPAAWPMAKLYAEGQARYDYSLAYVDQWSASPLDLVYPNAMHPWWGAALTKGYAQNIHENMLYLGLVAVALAVLGWRARRGEDTVRCSDTVQRRPFVGAIALVGALALVLSLGTTLHVGGEPVYLPVPEAVERGFSRGMYALTGKLALNPVRYGALQRPGAIVLPMPGLLLYLFLPFADAMRVWARFGLLTIFSVAVLAGLGVDALTGYLAPRRGLVGLAGAGLLALVLLDVAVLPYPYGYTRVGPEPVDAWLREQPRGAVAQFPLEKTWYGWALYPNALHGQPLAYGYGTFMPAPYRQAADTLATWPSTEAMQLLRDWGVRYILVGARSYGEAWPAVQRALAEVSDLEPVSTFTERPRFQGDRLLHLVPPSRAVPVTELIYGPLSAYLDDEMHVYLLRQEP